MASKFKVFSLGSCDVILRELALGSRDATTGLRLPSYTESTVKAIGVPRGAVDRSLGPGFYAKEDRMFLAAAPAELGDQFLQNSRYYMIKTKQKHDIQDSHHCYEYQCSELPMWEAALEQGTWKTGPDDPRYRSKVWLDTYVTGANITKNDNATVASWACIFRNRVYPLIKEFRASSAPVQGLYVISQPTTTPLIGVDQKVYGYTEEVPIFVDTVDSNACGGEQLLWKMEAELRSVCENYETGSYRGPTMRRANFIDLGSEQLFEIESRIKYVRDTS